MAELIGRKTEIEKLKTCYESDKAEFVIVSFGWESTSLEHLKKSSAHSWQASYLKA